MGEVIAGSGYHIMAVQEARGDFLQLDETKWSSTLAAFQCVLARSPAVVSPLASAADRHSAWLFAEIRYPQPRLGFDALRILSLRLHCGVAKAGRLEQQLRGRQGMQHSRPQCNGFWRHLHGVVKGAKHQRRIGPTRRR